MALSTPFLMTLPSPFENDYAGGLTDIQGLKVGHYTESRRPTGCTVVLAEGGAVAGVDVRGASPGTRETDLLDPVNTVGKIHGLVLSGGSSFGLETAAGVMQYLEEKGVGFKLGKARVPIVPAAILFDLSVGDHTIRPGKREGLLACRDAGNGRVREGNVGAGMGATIGKMLGMDRAMKSGLGSYSIRIGDLIVAALVAVNAVGDVRDPSTGRLLAGARAADKPELVDIVRHLRTHLIPPADSSGENTTLGVVATNAALSKAQATKVAQMAHDGYARAINPVHTPSDGDTVFALSVGGVKADLGQVGFLAAEAVAGAIVRAVKTAEGLGRRLPSYQDLARARS